MRLFVVALSAFVLGTGLGYWLGHRGTAAPLEPFPVLEPLSFIPVVKQVKVSRTSLPPEGGKFRLVVRAESNVPILKVSYSLRTAESEKEKGEFTACRAAGENLWECEKEFSLTPGDPPGVYGFYDVTAANKDSASLEFSLHPSATVTKD